MKCAQDKCGADAAFRYTWPGRPESGICDAHAPKLRAVARAIGLELELVAVADEEPLELLSFVDDALERARKVAARPAWALVHRGKPSSVVDAVAKGEVLERGLAAQGAVDDALRLEKIAALSRKLRTLATFNSSGAGVEAIEDVKQRRAFRLALYELADELEGIFE